jgi:hypothetical protein
MLRERLEPGHVGGRPLRRLRRVGGVVDVERK